MNKSVEVFMPYFKQMVDGLNLDVTPEQERGVRILVENAVTSDQAQGAEDILHLANGSADLYIALLQHIAGRDTQDNEEVDDEISAGDGSYRYANLWNALATILSMSVPEKGAKFDIISIEEE
jgi:hypothetical protein